MGDLDFNVEGAVPFFWIVEMARSLTFYVDGLGFQVTRRWEPAGELRWCRLELGGAAMMLQTFARDSTMGKTPGTLGAGVNIVFMCRDALAIHREAAARGVHAKEPFVGNGLWVVAFVDPDGYKMEFASPTDVPEDTTLSEWERRAP